MNFIILGVEKLEIGITEVWISNVFHMIVMSAMKHKWQHCSNLEHEGTNVATKIALLTAKS